MASMSAAKTVLPAQGLRSSGLSHSLSGNALPSTGFPKRTEKRGLVVTNMAKELYFNKDGSAIKKLQVTLHTVNIM